MPINPQAVGATSGPYERTWSSTDCILYALGVGAGADELAFTTEHTAGVVQAVLPTFAVIAGAGGRPSDIGTFDPAMLVHGEQAFDLSGPLPVDGRVATTVEVVGIYDKGSGAVIATEATSVDPSTGQVLFVTRSSAFVRGEGGWGGPRGPSGRRHQAPERSPDQVMTYETAPDQALLYRLSGDRNPLHSDPAFAARAGFERPILHGLCTYGFTGRALLHTLCDSDPGRFRGMEGRFSAPVYPGDLLTVSMWVDDEGAVFRTETQRGQVVIDAGRCWVG
ncbi:MAG: MaoC/PaaZ C-terminal domain-containing protein [Acidimicrobiales bacterium]